MEGKGEQRKILGRLVSENGCTWGVGQAGLPAKLENSEFIPLGCRPPRQNMRCYSNLSLPSLEQWRRLRWL